MWGRPAWELWSVFPDKVPFIERLRWRHRWSMWMEQRAKKQLIEAGMNND
jgi:hypothetical protein